MVANLVKNPTINEQHISAYLVMAQETNYIMPSLANDFLNLDDSIHIMSHFWRHSVVFQLRKPDSILWNLILTFFE